MTPVSTVNRSLARVKDTLQKQRYGKNCVRAHQLCITDSFPSLTVDVRPHRIHVQSAAGRDHLGPALAGYSLEWGVSGMSQSGIGMEVTWGWDV